METKKLSKPEIQFLLNQFHIKSYDEVKFIDSSHGDKDIRHNYIIDQKYVLRLNSAKVMNDERISELNRLVHRYRDFGMKAPLFLKNNSDTYTVEEKEYICYLSEYLNDSIANDVIENSRANLIHQRVIFIAQFAEKYKNVDLFATKSMYSLFELCPYDALFCGVDEKQDNCNDLVRDLNTLHETELADKILKYNDSVREELLSFYQELPRCVFQGDENFSNLCVDENNRIVGLFDFNMAGTDVIANYLANIAFQGNYYYTDEIFDKYQPQEILDMILKSYLENTALIQMHYQFTEKEFYAYKQYSKIVILFGYCNQAAYSSYMKKEKYKEKALELLKLLLEVQF